MKEKGQASDRERREWIIILVILLFGFLCVFLAGEQAIRLSPNWRLDTNMRSNLDPDSDFLTNRPSSLFEPLDPSILTQPVWVNLFLTPGASFPTRVPPSPTKTALPTNTSLPTQASSPTPRPPTETPTGILPTNTAIFFPPPATRTFTPVPSNTPVTPSPLSANLQITMSDGATTYTPGGATTYTITVYNLIGPNNVTGATVTDTFPAILTSVAWTCSGSGGGTCAASGSGNINDTVNLPFGSSVTYIVNANISPSASGNLVNTATVSLPGGITDPNLANNTVTDTDTPVLSANLQITKSNGTTTYIVGGTTTYTITVYNLVGPSNVTGATVSDIFPAGITSAAWTCTGSGGGTCTAGGSGSINDTVNLPFGSSVTYVVNANISPSASGNLVNTATVSLPGGITDPNPANNTVTDTDTPVFNVDLRIAKTDGVTSYTPGSPLTYTIDVTNPGGPANVAGATVTDIFPAIITSATWTCAPSGGGTCTAAGSGNINDTVNLPVGGALTYTVTANTDITATTSLVNTATVSAPGGYTDTAPANNSATDTDTPSLLADLNISKTSTTSNYAANGILLYTISVSNAGPASVSGATVTDFFPAQIAAANWICVPAGGAGCPLSGSGNINHTVDIPVGASLTYFVTAIVGSNPGGDLVNTATISAPPTVTDSNPTNNFSTFTHIPNVDLQITKDDGAAVYTAGGTTTYTITVTNNSTFNLTGITVSDPKPNLVTAWGWCVAPCVPAATSSANLSDTVNLAAGASVTYSVLANIHPNAAGDLVNTASVAVPSGYVDSAPGNNSATDSNASQNGNFNMGPPDNMTYPIVDGGSVTFFLNQPIVANGDAAADFAYYELVIIVPPPSIYIDQMIVDISADGVTWYRVFFWGDNNADTNTNVNNAAPPISASCPAESDNCAILSTDLYNNAGITIDVDNNPFGAVPLGNYFYIRFTEPGLGSTDGTHVDSVEILP